MLRLEIDHAPAAIQCEARDVPLYTTPLRPVEVQVAA